MRRALAWQAAAGVIAAVLLIGALVGQFQLRARQSEVTASTPPVHGALAFAAGADARGDWWMYGHDARHTGRSTFTGPRTGTLKWKFRSTGPGTDFTTPALGSFGKVYASCGPNLVALDRTGRERWFLPLQGSLSSPLLAAGGTLYVTGGQDQLYAVSPDGAVKWSFSVLGGLRGATVLTNERLVVLTGQDKVLHAVDATGHESWTYELGDHFIEAGPVADATGSIYLALYGQGIVELSSSGSVLHVCKLGESSVDDLQLYPDGSFLVREDDAICKISREGKELWRFEINGAYLPANLALRSDGTVFYGDSDGVVHALSAGGQEVWQYKSGKRIVATPVLGRDGAVAVLDDQATLTVLDLNGTPRFTKKLGGKAWFGIAPRFGADGKLYACGGGYLYALNRDGTEAWKHSGGGVFAGAPLLAADGTVYALCMDSTLYALRPDGSPRWTCPLESVDFTTPLLRADGSLIVSSRKKLYSVRSDGGIAWSCDASIGLDPGARPEAEQVNFGCSPALDPAGTIYVGTGDGRLLALKPDGTLAWTYQTAGSIMGSSPAVGPDGMIYIGTGMALNRPMLPTDDPNYLASQQDGKLYALKRDGKLAWSFTTGASIWASPVIADDGAVYVASTLGMMIMGGAPEEGKPQPCGKLFALTPQGKEKWSYPVLETTQGSVALGPDGTVYVCSWNRGFTYGVEKGGRLYAFSPQGKLVWEGPYGCLGSPCVGANGMVYSGGPDSKLYALSPGGNVLWSYQMGSAVAGSPVIAPDGTLYVGCSDGFLYAFRDI
jgi:outer membrane protein assembly factor BamB